MQEMSPGAPGGTWVGLSLAGSALHQVGPRQSLGSQDRQTGPGEAMTLESVEDPGSDHDPYQPHGCCCPSTEVSGSGSGRTEAEWASDTSLSWLLADKGTEAQGRGGLAM